MNISRVHAYAGPELPGINRDMNTTQNVSTGEQISKVKAAEIMFGTGSKQHLAAIARFGK